MHHGQSTGIVQWAAVLACAATFLAVVAYLAAARGLRRRGDAWPWRRDACFAAGGALLGAAMVAPLPGGPFTVHMTRHLLVGMAAPLPLVLARPLTLALRSLRPGPPRRTLLAAAHWRVSGWLLFPPVAAVLDMGGLWVLYRTPLLAAAHDRPWLHLLVHAHVFAAGVLFTAAICQLDPVRRRWGLPLRGLTLLAAGAAHAILAKTLYAASPPGTTFTAADLHTAAQLMYYGGDLTELALAATLATHWYTRPHASRGEPISRRNKEKPEAAERPRTSL